MRGGCGWYGGVVERGRWKVVLISRTSCQSVCSVYRIPASTACSAYEWDVIHAKLSDCTALSPAQHGDWQGERASTSSPVYMHDVYLPQHHFPYHNLSLFRKIEHHRSFVARHINALCATPSDVVVPGACLSVDFPSLLICTKIQQNNHNTARRQNHGLGA